MVPKMSSLGEYLSNDRWIISKLLLQTIEEWYSKTSANLLKFDIPFMEINWNYGRWMEVAFRISKGEWIGVLL